MLRCFLITCILGLFSTAYAGDSLTCEGKLNKKGEKHGIWACRKDNKVVRREQYKNGILKGYVIFNQKGEVIETRNKKGKVKKYTPCGC